MSMLARRISSFHWSRISFDEESTEYLSATRYAHCLLVSETLHCIYRSYSCTPGWFCPRRSMGRDGADPR